MFKNVTLEVSLKPFKHTDEEYIRKVCREIFTSWRPLLKNRETVSIMLWTADGSEILDYAGDLSESFDWARYMGTANLPFYDEKNDPFYISLHDRKRLYIENPPIMTYGVLKTIVKLLHEEGKFAFPDAKIRVGETFDIGPEFAFSDFKYNRHREVCTGSTTLDKCGIIDSTETLNGDTRKYAAFPSGIPDGTPFGYFLGKQSTEFLRDMGFDYLWLSNGLGFSADPWVITGKIFDGDKFHPEKLAKTRSKVFEFWKLFRAGCPDFPVETRGTNHSAGIDYASDGVPLYDIYHGNFDITPPPNSPWAALNDNYGLEIMGHMTRIAELPANDFMFRFYVHDPWWQNSPWYDRYDGSPSDIYLPMAVSRLGEDGRPQSAGLFSILSIDNTKGNMPDACVNEPLPHILKAEKDIADEAAPLVWVYPLREYTTAEDEETLKRMYFGDKLVMDAINSGLPLNCVVSTDNFLKHPEKIYMKSVVISPVPESNDILCKLKKIAELGIVVIIYESKLKSGSAKDSTAFKISDVTSENFVTILRKDGTPKTIASNSADILLKALKYASIDINFKQVDETRKVTTSAIVRKNNGLVFSVYNADTTCETNMSFLLGAPILSGGETVVNSDVASYRFARCEHRECRFFVKEKFSVVSCHEEAPVSAVFRRAIYLGGLKDATVCYFPEKYCEDRIFVAKAHHAFDRTPVLESGWEKITDEKQGTYWKKEHVTGEYYFYMPYENVGEKNEFC